MGRERKIFWNYSTFYFLVFRCNKNSWSTYLQIFTLFYLQVVKLSWW